MASTKNISILDKEFIKKLSLNPHIVGLSLNTKDLVSLLKEASRHYYASTDNMLFDDKIYDILYDILKQKDPDNKYFEMVGTGEPVINKVTLSYWMGSMDKVKPNSRQLELFLHKYKGPYLISEKLDGLSGLLIINKDGDMKVSLFTRGDGTKGQDVSNLLSYLQLFSNGSGSSGSSSSGSGSSNDIGLFNNKKLKLLIEKYNYLAIRGEIIIDKETFNKKYKDKYPKSRSLIAGTVNRKTLQKDIVKDMRFVAYEIIEPVLTPEQQFKFIEDNKMFSARNKLYSKIDETKLKELLLDYKSESEYDIDGIIITSEANEHYERVKSGNPKKSVAFKMMLDEQTQETKVINVEYNASKHGVLVPRVQFKPINIGGDTINYATGFNADFIKKHKLGPGAIIKVVRSGDVIPYIYDVVKGVDKWQQPDKKLGEWKWNDSKIDAVLINKNDNMGVRLKRLVHFFTTLNISGLKEGIIEKLYNAGYDDIKKIINLTPDILADMEGFQLKSSVKLYNAIHNVIDKPISLDVLMTASNIFEGGFGVRKFKMVLDTYPKLLDNNQWKQITKYDLTKIDGYSDKTAEKFIKYIPSFIDWLARHKELKYEYKTNTKRIDSNKSLSKSYNDYVVVFTGIRDKAMETLIENGGGKIGSKVNRKTTLVIADNIEGNSSKIREAKELGVKLINYEQAKKLFNK